MAVKKSTLYLDTSTINFLFADDAPEKKEITNDLFDNFIKTGIYSTYISNFFLQEINQTENILKRQKLLKVIDEYFIENLELNSIGEIQTLATLYIQKEVIRAKKTFDALHIAAAVVHKIYCLVGWNYKHLANVNREKKVLVINLEDNYSHPLRILTPLELIDYGN
jgi:predicted nucleic acid-binding protein